MKKYCYLISFVIINLFLVFEFDGFCQNYRIVGTGVTKCYNNNSVINCPVNANDPFYGQNQGISATYKDNGNGTISDLITGLMWIGERGEKITWDSAFLMAKQCRVGGYNDWRVPSIKELYSLINFNGKSGPTASTCFPYIDTNYFKIIYGDATGGRVIDGQDWSATQYTDLTMIKDTTIFGVNFIDGRIKGYPKYMPGPGSTARNKLYVRFVRGNADYGINNFVDNGDNTISDTASGLMWTKDDSKIGMNWQDALAWVQTKNSVNYLGYNDWRLPNVKELQSIVDYSRSPGLTNSAAISIIFNCTSITDEGGKNNWPYFWTNTTHLDNDGAAYISFGTALGYMKLPPTATYYTLADVHGAGAQRSDPKFGNPKSFFLGFDQKGDSVFGRGPQGDVQRINNFVRLVRNESAGTAIKPTNPDIEVKVFPNPSNGEIQIITPGYVSEIRIFNSLGQEVGNKMMEHGLLTKFVLNETGFYLILFKTSSGYITKGIIVNKD